LVAPAALAETKPVVVFIVTGGTIAAPTRIVVPDALSITNSLVDGSEAMATRRPTEDSQTALA